MAGIEKVLNQEKGRGGKGGKRKRALMERQLTTVLSKKGLQTRKLSSTKAKWHGECRADSQAAG